MAEYADVVAVVSAELDEIHGAIQDSLRQLLASDFSSPSLEARARDQVRAVDQDIRAIRAATKPVAVYTIHIPSLVVDRHFLRPSDVDGSELPSTHVAGVVYSSNSVHLSLSETIEEFIDD